MKFVISYKGNQINWIKECKTDEEAEKYLKTEEGDFREREIVEEKDLYKTMSEITGDEYTEDDINNDVWEFYKKEE